MRYFILLTLMITLASFHMPDNGISVSVSNLRNNKGYVLISLYKDGVGYPDNPDKAIRKAKLAIHNKQAVTSFTGLASGNYAIAILHDENDDQKMNKTFLGLPKEGYGFSNNVMGTFGPPSFSKASFSCSSGKVVSVSIKTRY